MVDTSGVTPGADSSGSAVFLATSQSPADSASDAGQFEALLSALMTDGAAVAGTPLQPFQNEMQAFGEAYFTVEHARDEARHQAQDYELVEEVGAAAHTQDCTPCGRVDRPAADGTFGKRETTVKRHETLASIAAEYGQTVDELLLANPNLTKDSVLHRGQTIAIYDANRLEIAKEMAATTDPETLKTLIRKEILYATSNSSTPADLLPAVQREIQQRRGLDDTEFAAIANAQSGWALELWTRQGRTHEVMDRLQLLVDQGDSEGLKAALEAILRDTAIRSPSNEAVQNEIAILIQYGPQSPIFAEALSEAANFIDYGSISDAAQQIADIYAAQGPLAAAALLAQLTDPSHFDPLSAALLLYAAGDTIAAIISKLGAGDQVCLTDTGPVTVDLAMKEQIFGYLNATVTHTGASPVAADAIERMAAEINVQMFTYIVASMTSGDGTHLPIEMLRLSETLDLYSPVSIGLNGINLLAQTAILSVTDSVRGLGDNLATRHQGEKRDHIVWSPPAGAPDQHKPAL